MMIERGISMRELKRIWESKGGQVIHRNRTGEVRFFNPRTKRHSGMVSARRKDAPVKLLTFIRRELDELSP